MKSIRPAGIVWACAIIIGASSFPAGPAMAKERDQLRKADTVVRPRAHPSAEHEGRDHADRPRANRPPSGGGAAPDGVHAVPTPPDEDGICLLPNCKPRTH